MTAKEKAKEIFTRIKAAFDMPMSPAAPAPPAPPPAAPTAKPYKLQDGTDITINQAGELPAPGDTVMVNGAPAVAGTLILQDGASITVDATGTITAYTAAMAAPPAPPPPAAPAPAVPITQAQMEIMFAKFGTGSADERLTNCEIMLKALMECNYGYQIREASEDAAIQAYKDSVALQVSSLMAASQKITDDQTSIITKHETTIQGLFELITTLVELPAADPTTLTPAKRLAFDRQQSKETKFEGIAAAITKMKKQHAPA